MVDGSAGGIGSDIETALSAAPEMLEGNVVYVSSRKALVVNTTEGDAQLHLPAAAPVLLVSNLKLARELIETTPSVVYQSSSSELGAKPDQLSLAQSPLVGELVQSLELLRKLLATSPVDLHSSVLTATAELENLEQLIITLPAGSVDDEILTRATHGLTLAQQLLATIPLSLPQPTDSENGAPAAVGMHPESEVVEQACWSPPARLALPAGVAKQEWTKEVEELNAILFSKVSRSELPQVGMCTRAAPCT